MFWATVLAILKTALYGWAVALWRLLKLILSWLRRKPIPGPEHRPTAPTPCTSVEHPAFVRPDPLLYSQRYLLDRGLAVTWDNPDIVLFRGGIPVSSAELEPATTYDVQVRIWNNSLEAPVVAMPVHLTFRDFGIGPDDIDIGTALADVGVKGSADQPGSVTIPWTTPATPGHYCLRALLDPADDVDYSNNLGQENTNVVEAQSPATFTFALRNRTKRAQTYRFELDGYELPPSGPCSNGGDPTQRLETHCRKHHPVPAGFDVQVVPATPTLGAGDEITVTVTIEPPGGFVGRRSVNVNAFHGQGFAGGVTLTVVKEP
jgi:hypothetical protein